MTQTETDLYHKDDELLALLKANPDIFQRHPELLELISLNDNRGTASLLERQIDTLKSRLAQFRSQHSELIEVARENEQISDSFSRILCQLIGFENLSEFAGEFPQALRKTFGVNEVAFKTARGVAQRPDEKPAYEDALRRLSHQHAVCDERWPSGILKLFFSEAIGSAALIPMLTSDRQTIGILALGSNDASRYTHDLGTAHLDRLGQMAGICLARLQPTE
ncbi:MAG: DUF484 family protein [Gammaproteobacteria bacterium]|nr:DUF484 family protein [Gammaproteobacteria bacterium]